MSDFRWLPVTKDPDEVRSVELSLFGLCATFWSPNELYETGEIVWPVLDIDEVSEDGTETIRVPSGIGYCFEAGAGGRSGPTQPRFWNADKTSAAVSVGANLAKLDGSVPWICRAATAGGINAASLADPSYVVPDPLTVNAILVNESVKLLVDYGGGTLDEDHEVVFRFLIAGRLRIGRQVVRIRKE